MAIPSLATRALFAGISTIGLAAAGAGPAVAFFDAPAKPKIDCTLKKNKSKPACRPSHREDASQEIYNAAYVLAKQERFAEALALLKRADRRDPRVLNYTGYVTRKLGDVEGALVFYRQALALNPNHTTARAYMGEALLQQGKVDAAKAELVEIEKRCGRACAEYADLAAHIAAHEGRGVGG